MVFVKKHLIGNFVENWKNNLKMLERKRFLGVFESMTSRKIHPEDSSRGRISTLQKSVCVGRMLGKDFTVNINYSH